MARKKTVGAAANKSKKTAVREVVRVNSRSVTAAPAAQPLPIEKKKSSVILRNVLGEDMNPKDYFFISGTLEEPIVPPFFNKVCGMPVDREDLLEIFNKIFRPEDNFLFYKTKNKEVYVVIIPLKFSQVSKESNSLDGDYQKHAISFIAEGSANPDALKTKLKRVAGHLKYENK